MSVSRRGSTGGPATLSAVLVRAVNLQLADAGVPLQKFADTLAEVYVATVPDAHRRAPIQVPPMHGVADDYFKAQRSNYKAVQRYMDGSVPIPADLVESWVDALDPRFRHGAVFDVCSRFGVLPVILGEHGDIAALADFMRDEAAAIEALAPILSDGVIDEKDAPLAAVAIDKLERAAADCMGLVERLKAVMKSADAVRR